MNNTKFNTELKLSIYQEDVLLVEKSFNIVTLNPFSKSVDGINFILPDAISKLKKMLSKKSYDVEFNHINLFQYNQQLINTYPNEWRSDMRYKPKTIIGVIDGEVVDGVQCNVKISNDDGVIGMRTFYVTDYNPVVRWSLDLVVIADEIFNMIFESIKKTDH